MRVEIIKIEMYNGDQEKNKSEIDEMLIPIFLRMSQIVYGFYISRKIIGNYCI